MYLKDDLTSPPVAIATAAVEMLGGDELVNMSRKPEIMADAAYLILTQNSKEYTGQFLIDDDVLTESGVTDLDQYAHAPGKLKWIHSETCLLSWSPYIVILL